MATFSVSFRVRRNVTHHAFVNVPIDEEVLTPEPDASGHRRLDAAKLVEMALRMANDPQTNWLPDGEPVIEPHPVQVAPDKKSE